MFASHTQSLCQSISIRTHFGISFLHKVEDNDILILLDLQWDQVGCYNHTMEENPVALDFQAASDHCIVPSNMMRKKVVITRATA